LSPLLEICGLSVDIALDDAELHAVRGVGFRLERGETLCLVGESGCGKSLTLLAIMGLLPASASRSARILSLDGRDLRGLSESEMSDLRGERIAMIFQEPMTSLNPVYTIGNQLEEALMRHQKVSSTAARDRAVFLLEKVGIPAAARRLKQYPHQLSGGLRQRVMIAMSMMCEPDIILADEPTTALDVTIQAEILFLLQELQRDFNMSVILVTHDLGVVSRVADRVAVMYAGQIVEIGTAEDLFLSPLHPYTQGLLACIPIPGLIQRGKPLKWMPGMVPSLVGEFSGCSFYDRCVYPVDTCSTTDIDLGEHSSSHFYRCVWPAEVLREKNCGVVAHDC